MIQKQPGEKLGISIRGGAKGHAGNPFDATDEGIFISKVSETTSCLMSYTTILQLSDFFVKFFFFLPHLKELEPLSVTFILFNQC